MKLTFLGKDSERDGSPTVYETDRGTFVVQGWKVDDSDALRQMTIPDHETCIEIPAGLLKYFPRNEG